VSSTIRPHSRGNLGAGLLVCALFAAGCGSQTTLPNKRSDSEAKRSKKQLVTSNIVRADYAGSSQCKDCHSKIYDKWATSPMRNMTRLNDSAKVRAPFDGTVFEFKGDTVKMETIDGERHMRIKGKESIERLFKITKVIGGTHREDFVGVRMVGRGTKLRRFGSERVMPASYVFLTKTWRYKGYSVMSPERPFIRVRAVWRKLCIFCHNTVPHLATIYDDLEGSGRAYQGSASRALPKSRSLHYEVTDAMALKRAVVEEMRTLGIKRPMNPRKSAVKGTLRFAMTKTSRKFNQKHLVEVGIGCESCHGGAKQHADDPTLKPTFEPRSQFLRARAADSNRTVGKAEWINRTCARCHTVLFSRYEPTWEGGKIKDQPGGSTINSGEARNYLLGGCSKKMSCTTCHDPHAKDDPAARAKLQTLAGNAVCTKCHAKYDTPIARAAHTHHKADGAGSVCIRCHMAKKNLSLTYDLTRYHRIGSPTDKNRVEKDRPLECAICHDDKSVNSLVTSMEAWWGKRYDRSALRRLYGADLNVNTMTATLNRGMDHEKAVAIGVFGERRRTKRVRQVAAELTNRIVLIRHYAKAALEKITGKPVAIDLDASVADIKAAAAELFPAETSASAAHDKTR